MVNLQRQSVELRRCSDLAFSAYSKPAVVDQIKLTMATQRKPVLQLCSSSILLGKVISRRLPKTGQYEFFGREYERHATFVNVATEFGTINLDRSKDKGFSTMGIRLDKYLLRTGSPIHEAAVRNYFEVQGNCGCCSGNGFESVLQGEGKINDNWYSFRFEAKTCFRGSSFSKFCKHYKVQSFELTKRV